MSNFYDLLLAKKLSGGGGADPGGGGSDWEDPTDSKTHIYINFPEGTPANRRFIELNFDTGQYYPLVEWGDGSSDQISADGIATHTYAKNGTYDISLAASGPYYFKNASFGSNMYVRQRIIGAWLDGTYGTPNNFQLGSDTTRAKRLHICGNIPRPNVTLGRSGLEVLELEEGITNFSAGNYLQLYSMTKVTIPSTVTNMTGGSNFYQMTGMSEYHFKPTTPPSLTSGAFTSIPADCKIFVPAASVDAYKSASVWSTVADYIFGE